MTSIIKLKHVSLKRNGQWILKDINWEIQKHENWVLYGLNGAGKTALLNMLCAYYFPTEGDVKVLGKAFGHDYLAENFVKNRTSIDKTTTEILSIRYCF